jgi:RNA polymerase sigma factor (sigma-70 family)
MTNPPSPPPEDPFKPSEPPSESVMTAPAGLGLSRAQVEEVIGAMRGVIIEVGFPAHIPLLDIVHDAFVTALCKPISERPPMSDWKRFVAWMCTLARYAALTNRNIDKRRGEEGEISDDDIAADERLAELLSTSQQDEDPFVRDALRKAFVKLDPKDQDILNAHYRDNKTIIEIARETNMKWSVVDQRRRRALDRLHALLKAILAAITLLFTKNARAQIARLAQRVSPLFPQATQMASVMTVTVACGALVPASSMADVAPREAMIAMPLLLPASTIAAAVESPSRGEVALVKLPVAPVKPIVDMAAQQCSSQAMKSTQIASSFLGTVLPFAFIVAPAITSTACAGTDRQTPPPQVPEERDDSSDPYDIMCEDLRHRGNACPTREEWHRRIGLCADGTDRCK